VRERMESVRLRRPCSELVPALCTTTHGSMHAKGAIRALCGRRGLVIKALACRRDLVPPASSDSRNICRGHGVLQNAARTRGPAVRARGLLAPRLAAPEARPARAGAAAPPGAVHGAAAHHAPRGPAGGPLRGRVRLRPARPARRRGRARQGAGRAGGGRGAAGGRRACALPYPVPCVPPAWDACSARPSARAAAVLAGPLAARAPPGGRWRTLSVPLRLLIRSLCPSNQTVSADDLALRTGGAGGCRGAVHGSSALQRNHVSCAAGRAATLAKLGGAARQALLRPWTGKITVGMARSHCMTGRDSIPALP